MTCASSIFLLGKNIVDLLRRIHFPECFSYRHDFKMGSRGLFANFLLNMLESGEAKELEWIDKDKKLFRISWKDRRRPAWKNEENILFKEWEKYKDRYEEGGEKKWDQWKQNFKGALSTCREFIEIEPMSRSKCNHDPFKAFQFCAGFDIALSNSCTVQHAQNECTQQSNVFKEPQYCLPGYNIPKVVDELCTGGVLLNEVTGTTNDYMTNDNHFQCNENAEQQQLADAVMYMEMCDVNNTVDGHPSANATSKALDSDEFDSYFQQKSFSTMDVSKLPSLNTPGNSLERAKSTVKFQVYYSNICVLEETMDLHDTGVSLFFGSKILDFEALYGPQEFMQVRLPDVTQCSDLINKKNKKLIENIENVLEKMTRGLLLYCKEEKVFAQRLCQTRISAWNNLAHSVTLNRKSESPYLLFDMNYFESQLKCHETDPKNNVCPSPKVILVFGQNCEPHNIVSRELLVHIELTYVKAEELLIQELSNGQDLQFSGMDSGDELIQKIQTALNLNTHHA